MSREDELAKKRAWAKAWNAAHPELHRARVKAWRLANPEKRRAQIRKEATASGRRHRRWREANLERARELSRAWYRHNRERSLENIRKWQAANRDRVREIGAGIKARRRTREYGSSGSHTTREWVEKCALFGRVCVYCGEAKPLTRDHNIPLSRGGSNSIENILPACLSCNGRKGTRTASEFISR